VACLAAAARGADRGEFGGQRAGNPARHCTLCPAARPLVALPRVGALARRAPAVAGAFRRRRDHRPGAQPPHGGAARAPASADRRRAGQRARLRPAAGAGGRHRCGAACRRTLLSAWFPAPGLLRHRRSGVGRAALRSICRSGRTVGTRVPTLRPAAAGNQNLVRTLRATAHGSLALGAAQACGRARRQR